MGLFENENNRATNRDYSSAFQFGAGVAQRSDAELATFIKDTYKLFAATMLSGAAGAYVGVGIAPIVKSAYWLFVILEFALLFGINFVKHSSPLNLIVVFAFTFVSGLTIGPLLNLFLGMEGGSGIVAQAFFMTTIVFGFLSVFAIKTTADFTSLGKPLFIAFIVVFVLSIVNIFLGSPVLHVIISAAMVMLFSVFVIFDTQNIIQGNYETPIDGAVALYLDFFNLFVSLLQILGILGSDD
jgi:modulator of FtsH protease